MTLSELQQDVGKLVAKTFGRELDLRRFEVSYTAEAKFGDFTTNAAMVYAADLKRPPRELAEQLAEVLRKQLPEVEQVEVAGPGFINMTLSDAALGQLAADAPDVRLDAYAGKTVVVEYSDPNPFKPLHAGHLYTTLVGDSVSRLIGLAGAKLVRVNYGGDVGLHVGKSLWAIVKHLGGELPDKLAEIAEAERPAWMGARYVEGNSAYDDDEAARAEIIEVNKRVYGLHETDDRDSAFARIYWTCRQWSYDYFEALYDQLEVAPFDRYVPESEVTPLGLKTVREQLAKGVYKNSDGAVVFDGEPFGLHTRVFINSHGLPTYEAKDVGLSLTKWRDYHFDRSVIITSHEQADYMKVVVASIKQFAPEPAERTLHLTHGVVKLQGGTKMSSRAGNIVSAVDILDAARAAAAGLPSKLPDESVLAAVKYAFVKNRIGADTVYDPKESVSLEGNSGPYLQYAHARARSILAKAAAGKARHSLGKLEPVERALAREIGQYPEILRRSVDELMPHHICTYLYGLAQLFNRFYEHNRVVGDEREGVRLELVRLYAEVLKGGLDVLGIVAPDRL